MQKSPGPGRECSGVGQQLELALKATTQHTLTHTHSGKRHTRARAYVTHMLPMAAGRHRRQGVRRVCLRTRPHASVRFVLGAFGCCLPMTPHHSTPLCQPTAPPTPVLSAHVCVCVALYHTQTLIIERAGSWFASGLPYVRACGCRYAMRDTLCMG